jgi:hypothetical protein
VAEKPAHPRKQIVKQIIQTGRRKFVTQGGAALLAAAILPRTRSTIAAQGTTPTTATPASPEASPEPEIGETRVAFTVGDIEIIVHIADNPTSADFLSLLPLELTFEDFASMEKLCYLPRELTTEGSTSTTPADGDLIYFEPWGNLGSFYNAELRDTSFDDRVFLIGTVDSGIEQLAELETGPVHVDTIP